MVTVLLMRSGHSLVGCGVCVFFLSLQSGQTPLANAVFWRSDNVCHIIEVLSYISLQQTHHTHTHSTHTHTHTHTPHTQTPPPHTPRCAELHSTIPSKIPPSLWRRCHAVSVHHAAVCPAHRQRGHAASPARGDVAVYLQLSSPC